MSTLSDYRRRKTAQKDIMGVDETRRQEREQLAAENAQRRDPGAPGRAAIKRVGEYKEKKKEKTGFDPKRIDDAYQGEQLKVDHPGLKHLQGDEEATPEEEAQLQEGIVAFGEWFYSEEGLSAAAKILTGPDDADLLERVPKVVVPALQMVHQKLPEAGSPIFFGEGGLIQDATARVLELAEQLKAPGYDSTDQMQGAVINVYKTIGEMLLQGGDEEVKAEAKSLGEDMHLTDKDGSRLDPESAQVASLGGMAGEREPGLLMDSVYGPDNRETKTERDTGAMKDELFGGGR